MEGRNPNRLGESLAPRQKRIFVVVCAVLVVLGGGVGAWAATNSGRYGAATPGCVNVTVPSTTGGAILHECGAAARTLCRNAFSHHDRLSVISRGPCRTAGLGVPGHGAPASP